MAEIDALFTARAGEQLDSMRLLRLDPRALVAEPTGTLTQTEVIRRALDHNLALVASAESLPIAQAQLAQAGLFQNPSLGGTGPVAFPLSTGGGAVAFDAALSQVINTFWTQPYRVAVATAQRFQAGIDLASQAYDLVQQAESKYGEMAHLLRDRRLAGRLADTYKRAWDAAEARVKVGAIPRSDVNRAKIQYQDQLRQARHLDTQYAKAAREMNWLMGVSSAPQWSLPAEASLEPGPLPPLPQLPPLEDLGRRSRLDLLRSTFDLRIAEENVKLARLGFVPNVTLGPDVGRDSSKHWSAGFTWAVELPIFDTGKVGLILAEAQRRLADKTYVALEGQVAQDVRSAYDDLRTADEDVRFYREKLIPQQEENVRLAETSFRLGNSDLDDLLNTLRDYVATLQAYEDAIDTYYTNRVALEKAVGAVWGRIQQQVPATQPAPLPEVAPPRAATTNSPSTAPTEGAGASQPAR